MASNPTPEFRAEAVRVALTSGLPRKQVTAQVGYRQRPGRYGGKPAIVAENRLEQRFETPAPDHVWMTEITYLRTNEGWLYLCVVIDLFSRRVVGW